MLNVYPIVWYIVEFLINSSFLFIVTSITIEIGVLKVTSGHLWPPNYQIQQPFFCYL